MQCFSDPTIVIDTSGAEQFAGVLSGPGPVWAASGTSHENALEGMFGLVSEVLEKSGFAVADLRGFIYCKGPGSVLGLRLAAMAIETLRRLNPGETTLSGYNSLVLTALLLADGNRGRKFDALLVSDWKKDVWNAVAIKAGVVGEPGPLDAGFLDSVDVPLYHLPRRKGWQAPPSRSIPVAYEPQRIAQHLDTQGLLGRTASVELYSASATTFRKWTAERHGKVSEI